MSENDHGEAGAPRAAIWRRHIEWLLAETEMGIHRDDPFETCKSPRCVRWREIETALRACADPPEESREEQDLSAILQSVLQMIGLPGFNAAWFDEHGDWDFGKLRDHGLDAKLAEIRAALRACAEAPDKTEEIGTR